MKKFIKSKRKLTLRAPKLKVGAMPGKLKKGHAN